MLFDNFDKKIKEAAEQHHPAYDENAWRKMENLLDQHLPRENNRRRFFLLAFTVLLIGGGAYVYLSKLHSRSSELVVQQNDRSANSETAAVKADKDATIVLPGIDNGDKEIATDHTATRTTTKIVDKDGNVLNVTDKNVLISRQSTQRTDKNQLEAIDKPISDRNNGVAINPDEKKGDETLRAPVVSGTKEPLTKDEKAVSSPVAKPDEVASNAQQVQGSSATKTAPKKARPGLMNGLSFFVSAGPDISKAENSKTGKVTMSWGFGIAYSLNRFTLRTGVFTASKIYWASPEDYKLSYTPPANLKFMGADANCRVTEIPVKLSYNFGVKDKSNWFAGAGLSSYLMKREDYLYEYKSNTTGNSYYHSYETKNENKHYFSVLNLSGGYTYRFGKTISMSAEPYLELPLTGIGAGKVHLNSGGVLFTIGVSPFRK
jgi:hypothetical protein